MELLITIFFIFMLILLIYNKSSIDGYYGRWWNRRYHRPYYDRYHNYPTIIVDDEYNNLITKSKCNYLCKTNQI